MTNQELRQKILRKMRRPKITLKEYLTAFGILWAYIIIVYGSLYTLFKLMARK